MKVVPGSCDIHCTLSDERAYFVVKNGELDRGPFSLEQLRLEVTAGRVLEGDLVENDFTGVIAPAHTFLTAPQPPPRESSTPSWEPRAMPPNYLTLAVLASTFCCLPLGLVALAYSIRSMAAYDGEHNDRAAKWGETAGSWGWAAVLLGAFLYLVYFGIVTQRNQPRRNRPYQPGPSFSRPGGELLPNSEFDRSRFQINPPS